jgi:hypothetical protein
MSGFANCGAASWMDGAFGAGDEIMIPHQMGTACLPFHVKPLPLPQSAPLVQQAHDAAAHSTSSEMSSATRTGAEDVDDWLHLPVNTLQGDALDINDDALNRFFSGEFNVVGYGSQEENGPQQDASASMREDADAAAFQGTDASPAMSPLFGVTFADAEDDDDDDDNDNGDTPAPHEPNPEKRVLCVSGSPARIECTPPRNLPGCPLINKLSVRDPVKGRVSFSENISIWPDSEIKEKHPRLWSTFRCLCSSSRARCTYSLELFEAFITQVMADKRAPARLRWALLARTALCVIRECTAGCFRKDMQRCTALPRKRFVRLHKKLFSEKIHVVSLKRLMNACYCAEPPGLRHVRIFSFNGVYVDVNVRGMPAHPRISLLLNCKAPSIRTVEGQALLRHTTRLIADVSERVLELFLDVAYKMGVDLVEEYPFVVYVIQCAAWSHIPFCQ